MVLQILRALFVLLMAAIGWSYITNPNTHFTTYNWLALAVTTSIAVLLVCIDILSTRRKLVVFSGVFLGLIVGISVSYGLSFVVRLVVEQWMPIQLPALISPEQKISLLNVAQTERESLIQFINMLVGVAVSYLSISFILQTKDDFRFIIPYVEFNKQTKGARPILLDTSVLIDGRINDIARSGIFESQLIVPRFVIKELQLIADSSDKLKRNRGRRGLDTIAELKTIEKIEVVDYDPAARHDSKLPVDEQLLSVAKDLSGRVLTNDLNLNKVATLQGVAVINLNDLANAMKPMVLPGERMAVRIVKAGEEPGQGVGYLDDGTMVVVEQSRQFINQEVEFTVTNMRQTTAGKMIFGRIGGDAPSSPTPRPRPRSHSESST